MISIAMATYNGEKYLGDQIDSILNQTIQDFELIVCDDCSTDNTWNILLDYQLHDKRIKCYRNEKNLGFKKNFEKAIGLCTGDYIALSDQDDVWTEEHLEVLFENIGESDLVGAGAFLSDKDGKPFEKEQNSHFGEQISCFIKNKDDWFFYLLHQNCFQGAASLFKKSLVKKALPIPENIQFHDYWLALIAASDGGFKYVDKKIFFYRQHGNNVTDNERLNFFEKIKLVIAGKELRKKVKLQINYLTTLQQYIHKQEQIKQIQETLAFFRNRGTYKNFKCIPYFYKNYSRIYLSQRNGVFWFRFIKMLTGK